MSAMTQADALKILKMGQNVFLTGSAGSGKTYVLNSFIRYLREHDIDVAVTASTGIAATHMGGMTIHAWSGLGIKDFVSDYDIDMMEEKKYLWDRFEKVKVLVIDEISMLSGNFLDNLDRVCRSFKRNPEKAFGGIQVVLCGDLFQLPPISRNETVDMVIDSNVWKNMSLVMCYLTEQHRQEDSKFLDILNAMRAGTITRDHMNTLEARIREYDEDDFKKLTKLFTHNADVDAINGQELYSIDEREYTYRMTTKGKSNLIDNLIKSCLAPQVLHLKLGAEVMFVKNNFDKGYVNGTRGIVTDFGDDNMPVVTIRGGEPITVETETWAIEDDGKVLASIMQLPLRHAWAITVHKSQGMSLDAAVIDLTKTFTYGMGYVALSRVRTLGGVHLLGLSEDALNVDPRVLAIDQSLQKLSDRAAERIAEYSDSDLQKSHDDFITRSGGSLEAKALSKKELGQKSKVSTQKTHEASYELIKAGKTIDEAAKERDIVPGTVIEHLAKARELGWDINLKHIKPKKKDLKTIGDAFEMTKSDDVSIQDAKLTPVKRYLDQSGEEYSFDDIKLARLFLK